MRLNDDPKVASEVDLKASYLGMGGGNALRPPLAMSLACIVMASQLLMPLQDLVVTFQNSRVFQTSYLQHVELVLNTNFFFFV